MKKRKKGKRNQPFTFMQEQQGFLSLTLIQIFLFLFFFFFFVLLLEPLLPTMS